MKRMKNIEGISSCTVLKLDVWDVDSSFRNAPGSSESYRRRPDVCSDVSLRFMISQ